MKLLWTDVKELFQECTVWAHGQEMVWFEQVWRIFDQKGLTLWNSTAEKIAVYNRIYGTIWIFRNFCMAGFEEDAYFDFYWESSLPHAARRGLQMRQIPLMRISRRS